MKFSWHGAFWMNALACAICIQSDLLIMACLNLMMCICLVWMHRDE